MKIVQETREVVATGIGRARAFSVEIGAHIMAVLSGLYKNPLDAIVREYLSNMIDAYLALGVYDSEKHPIPILHLPTAMEPWLEFRDHGIGMSVDTVWNIYSTYGLSTKNDDNSQVGGFGLGSKTAFCYQNGQAWTIESRFDGMKHLFMASLDENNLPTLYHASSVKTDEPNGVSIRIPILRQDVPEVQRAAKKYVPYFPMELTVLGGQESYEKPAALFEGETWRVGRKQEYGYSVTVVMGNVPYALDGGLAELVFDNIAQLRGKYGKHVEMVLPIGSVDLVPSRDSLKQTERTKNVLTAESKKLSAEYNEAVKQKLESFSTQWDKSAWLAEMSNAGFLENKHTGYSVTLPFAVDVHKTFGDRGEYSKVENTQTVDVPLSHIYILRNDGVRNIDVVARWILADKCYHKTRKGHKSKYGHKTGSVFVINTKLSNEKVSELFGGIPLDRFLGGASQFVGVAKKMAQKGAENIYRYNGQRSWDARVRIPETDTVYYVVLEQDSISKRWSYYNLSEMVSLLREFKMNDITIYGIRRGEEDTFKYRKGWVNLEQHLLDKMEKSVNKALDENPFCPALERQYDMKEYPLLSIFMNNEVVEYLAKTEPLFADIRKIARTVLNSYNIRADRGFIPFNGYEYSNYRRQLPAMVKRMEEHDKKLTAEIRRLFGEVEKKYPMVMVSIVMNQMGSRGEAWKLDAMKRHALDYVQKNS